MYTYNTRTHSFEVGRVAAVDGESRFVCASVSVCVCVCVSVT